MTIITISCGLMVEDSLRTEEECGELINNPVEIEDYEALKLENDTTCYHAGQEDGKTGKPFNEKRDDGCYEFDDISGGYEDGYQSGCETHTTESSCELLYEDKSNYCPNHPDIVGCVDFLHNATNKKTENPYTTVCDGIYYIKLTNQQQCNIFSCKSMIVRNLLIRVFSFYFSHRDKMSIYHSFDRH